jgi:hypothetical protein
LIQTILCVLSLCRATLAQHRLSQSVSHRYKVPPGVRATVPALAAKKCLTQPLLEFLKPPQVWLNFRKTLRRSATVGFHDVALVLAPVATSSPQVLKLLASQFQIELLLGSRFYTHFDCYWQES